MHNMHVINIRKGGATKEKKKTAERTFALKPHPKSSHQKFNNMIKDTLATLFDGVLIIIIVLIIQMEYTLWVTLFNEL